MHIIYFHKITQLFIIFQIFVRKCYKKSLELFQIITFLQKSGIINIGIKIKNQSFDSTASASLDFLV